MFRRNLQWEIALIISYMIPGILSHVLYTTEAFHMSISRNLFKSIEAQNLFDSSGLATDIEYRLSLLNLPDLPRWMFYRHPNGSEKAYIYGAPEEAGTFSIEVIAMNKDTYNTSQEVISFNVRNRNERALYEVEVKLLNLNVEDMFESNRLQLVKDIFKDHLWKSSNSTQSVYITMVASSVDVGGRLPLNPKDKEGVVIRVGCTENYTKDLLDLEREVFPLRKRFPCPKDYRRTAVEHLFRRRDLISDWCSFRLVSKMDSYHGGHHHGDGSSPVLLKMNDFQLPSSRLPRRDFLLDFLVSIVVPMVVVLLLLLSLTCLMCCHREGVEKRNKETPTVQLNHFNSIQRASHPLRHLVRTASKPESSPSPGSTLTRSRTGSPTSTLPRAYPSSQPGSQMNTLRSTGNTLPANFSTTRSNPRCDP